MQDQTGSSQELPRTGNSTNDEPTVSNVSFVLAPPHQPRHVPPAEPGIAGPVPFHLANRFMVPSDSWCSFPNFAIPDAQYHFGVYCLWCGQTWVSLIDIWNSRQCSACHAPFISSMPSGLFLPRGMPAHVMQQEDWHPQCQLALFGFVHGNTRLPQVYPTTVPQQDPTTVPVQAESSTTDQNEEAHEGETEATTGQELNSSTEGTTG